MYLTERWKMPAVGLASTTRDTSQRNRVFMRMYLQPCLQIWAQKTSMTLYRDSSGFCNSLLYSLYYPITGKKLPKRPIKHTFTEAMIIATRKFTELPRGCSNCAPPVGLGDQPLQLQNVKRIYQSGVIRYTLMPARCLRDGLSPPC